MIAVFLGGFVCRVLIILGFSCVVQSNTYNVSQRGKCGLAGPCTAGRYCTANARMLSCCFLPSLCHLIILLFATVAEHLKEIMDRMHSTPPPQKTYASKESKSEMEKQWAKLFANKTNRRRLENRPTKVIAGYDTSLVEIVGSRMPMICQACPGGKYTDEFGQHSCKLCAAGTYQPERNSAGCLVCEKGRYKTHSGAGSCRYCAFLVSR